MSTNKIKAPLNLRAKVAVAGAKAVFRSPAYAILALVSGFIAIGFILWSLNLDTLSFILRSDVIGPLDKLDILLDAYGSLFLTYDNVLSLVFLMFGLFFGINTALLVYVLRRQIASKKDNANSLGGLILATIGGGCAACGTSLLTPLLATIGVTSSFAVARISLWASVIGIVLIAISAFSLAQKASTAQHIVIKKR